MPVVAPMVSAATGALLLPHLSAGSGRATLLYGCSRSSAMDDFAVLYGVPTWGFAVLWTALTSRAGHAPLSAASALARVRAAVG